MARAGTNHRGGRPKGSMEAHTLARMKAEKEMKERVVKSMSALLNAQMALAKGVSYLYKVEKDGKGNDMKAELVTSQSEIEDYLAENYDKNQTYYYITTEKPENKALDSLFDRVFGKAKEHVDITTDDKPLGIVGIVIQDAKNKQHDAENGSE